MIVERFLDSVNISILLSTIFIFIGWMTTTPRIFSLLSFIVKIILGLYLVIKFSGLFPSLHAISYLDRKIFFLSGTYLLVFTLGDYIHNVAYRARPWVLSTIEQLPQIKL